MTNLGTGHRYSADELKEIDRLMKTRKRLLKRVGEIVSINDRYLWRAVDCEGEVLDVLVQSRRNTGQAMTLAC
jgi:transposase-like protein